MKKPTSILIMAVVLAGMTLSPTIRMGSPAAADTTVTAQVDAGTTAELKAPLTDAAIVAELKSEFNMTDGQIAILQSSDMETGQAVLLLAVTAEMQGGMTDSNLNTVLDLRQSGLGWGEVADKVGVKLGEAVSKIRQAVGKARSAVRDEVQARKQTVERIEDKAEARVNDLRDKADQLKNRAAHARDHLRDIRARAEARGHGELLLHRD